MYKICVCWVVLNIFGLIAERRTANFPQRKPKIPVWISSNWLNSGAFGCSQVIPRKDDALYDPTKRLEENINEKMEEDDLVMETCNIDNPPTGREPIYKTRPDRFLMPLIGWGPNNQLRGFREAAILAVKLNRTLCIPPFFKHHSDSTSASKENVALHPFRARETCLIIRRK